jgi:hypothetical protein
MLLAPRVRRKCSLGRLPGARVQTPMEEARRPQLSRHTLHCYFAVRIGLELEDIMRRRLVLRSEAPHGRVRIAERKDKPKWSAVTRLLGAIVDPPPIAFPIEEMGQRSAIDNRWHPDGFRVGSSFGHVTAVRVGSCGQLVFTPTRASVPFSGGRQRQWPRRTQNPTDRFECCCAVAFSADATLIVQTQASLREDLGRASMTKF